MYIYLYLGGSLLWWCLTSSQKAWTRKGISAYRKCPVWSLIQSSVCILQWALLDLDCWFLIHFSIIEIEPRFSEFPLYIRYFCKIQVQQLNYKLTCYCHQQSCLLPLCVSGSTPGMYFIWVLAHSLR